MYLWVVTVAVLLPPLIMGIFAVLQKIKRDKDIDMKDEDFIVEISDSIISMGVMIDLVSAGIMVGFTIFTENLPPLIFYAVFGLLFWIGSFLIYRTLTFKVIVKDKKSLCTLHLAKHIIYLFQIWTQPPANINPEKPDMKRLG